jgi:hypothetical protein
MKAQKTETGNSNKSRVEVYSSSNIIRGFIYRSAGSRLLDVLNQTGKEITQSRSNFLHITDAIICTPDNQEITMPSIFLNNSNFFFIK